MFIYRVIKHDPQVYILVVATVALHLFPYDFKYIFTFCFQNKLELVEIEKKTK